ncbi:oxidoreductase, short chain dehydrogenase/reductase family protein [Cooperia oncophora]
MVYPASVFITGANRGIGLGLVREFLKVPAVKHVIAGARNPDNAEELNAITDKRLSIVKIDIDCDQSIKDAYKQVEAVVGESGLNVLLNNAAILPPYFTNGAICRDTLMKCVNTNVLGTAIVSQTFLPLLRKASSHGEGDHWGLTVLLL